MYSHLLHPRNPAFQGSWGGDIQRAFFKCTKWQLEETLDPLNCPYHYYCSSSYPGDYPAWVDITVLVFTAASFLATLILMVVDMLTGRNPIRLTQLSQSRRYLLPSGPVFLPVILIIMAKGYRINTDFPMSYNGPALLQLVRMSALAFATETESDIKYVFLEASTVSGILHTALYLDSVILPYYTGLDALVSSRFSGECLTCVCREKVLVVGGRLVSYRGWSVTTALVAGTVVFRMFCRLAMEGKGRMALMRMTMEGLSWILIALECVYLLIVSPREGNWTTAACFGGVYVLLCLQLLKRLVGTFVAYLVHILHHGDQIFHVGKIEHYILS